MMGWGFFVLHFNILIKKETKDKSVHEFVFLGCDLNIYHVHLV